MSGAGSAEQGEAVKVLVYSDDRNVRAQARSAMGRRVASDLPEIEIIECATANAVVANADTGEIDLFILDGESTPHGGMGLCRTLKDEIVDCAPVLLMVARRDDAWLASWSRAEGIVSHPVDPVRMPQEVARVLRGRLAGTPATA